MNQTFNELFVKYKALKKSQLREGSFKTLEKLESKIHLFEKTHGILLIQDINMSWTRKFIKGLITGKYGRCQNSTIKLYGSVLMSFLKQARIHGYRVSADIDQIGQYFINIKVLNNDKAILDIEEISKLYNYRGFTLKNGVFRKITQYQKYSIDLFIFQTQTGLRWGDISRIKRRHLIEKNNEWYLVNFETQKRNKLISVHLNSLSVAIMRKYTNFEKYSSNSIIFKKTPSCSNVTHILKTIAKRVELTREIKVSTGKLSKRSVLYKPVFTQLSTHTARRTFASNWIKEGKDVYKLSKVLGHSSVLTTERYIKNIDNFIPEGIENDLDYSTQKLFNINGTK